ncbi:unnamed protein product [Gadus morhua 'NCC']
MITERKNATRQKENHLPWAGSCIGQQHVTLSRYLKGRAEEGSEAIYFGLTPNELPIPCFLVEEGLDHLLHGAQ